MSKVKFNPGDYVVVLETAQSMYKEDPLEIIKNTIGINVSTNADYVFFKDTKPGRGSWQAKHFRLATQDEISQYEKGKRIAEPESPFEEEEIIVALEDVNSVEGDYSVQKNQILKIDGIVKTKDLSKSVMYFVNEEGYYPVTGAFARASVEQEQEYETD